MKLSLWFVWFIIDIKVLLKNDDTLRVNFTLQHLISQIINPYTNVCKFYAYQLKIFVLELSSVSKNVIRVSLMSSYQCTKIALKIVMYLQAC